MHTIVSGVVLCLLFATTIAVAVPVASSRNVKNLVHDVGSIKPTRSKRTGASNSQAFVDQSKSTHIHVTNAYISESDVSVRLPLASFDDMSYGDVRTVEVESSLKLTDSYRVSVGNESYAANVSGSVTHIPRNSDVFVITDVAADERGSLHNTFSIWDREDRITPGHFWLLTYNAFSHSGLDVLVFDSSKVGTDQYSLQRIGMDIDSFDAYYVELPVSTYELKIVPHDAVLNIDDFKNMPSLAPPIYINPQEGTRYYGAIIGVYGEVGKFRPDYVTVPPFPVAPPPRTPYTRVIVMNAFPRDSDVEVTFKSSSHFRALPYGQSTSGSLHLKQNDPYRIDAIPSENENGYHNRMSITSHVEHTVPYLNSECLLITDTLSTREQLDKYFLCWEEHYLDLHPNHVFFFTYNALVNFSEAVDVVLFDRDTVGDPNTRSLLNIAPHLKRGHGLRAQYVTPPKSHYEVKVVKSGTITNSLDFDTARSLLPPMVIKPKGDHRYYLVLSGVAHNRKYPPALISYPPELIHPGVPVSVSPATVSTSKNVVPATKVPSPTEILHYTVDPDPNLQTTSSAHRLEPMALLLVALCILLCRV